MKLLRSTMDIKGGTVTLVVTGENGREASSAEVTLEELDQLIVDLHKVRLGLAITTKAEIGMEMATKKMLKVEEEKIRSILIPEELITT